MKLRMETDGRKHVMPVALGVASMSLSGIILGNMTYYLTTVVGLPGTLVGTILLLSRFFDGVSDLVAGTIIDKCHFKLGKARPFDLMNIPMWIALVLCYSVPNLNTVAKVIYIFIMYNLCQTVFFTFVSVSGSVRGKRTFLEEARAKATSLIGIMTALLSTIGGIMLPILIEKLEYQPYGWTKIALFFAVPGILMSLCMFLFAPEMQNAVDEDVQASKGFVDNMKILSKNKYLVYLVLVVILSTLAMTLTGSVATYYFKYYVGDLSMSSILGVVSIVGYIFLAFLPKMTSKVGNRKSLVISFGIMAVGAIARIANPKSFVWLSICGLIFTIGTAMAACLRDLILMDAMHYGEVVTKTDCEGSYAAIKGFADKVANGLAPFVIGVVLDIMHFNSQTIEQPGSAISAIVFMYIFLPTIMGILGMLSSYFCKMDEALKQYK